MTEVALQKRDCTVGICPECSRVVFASAPIEGAAEREALAERKRLAKDVSRMIVAGFRVETWTADEVRAANWGHRECRLRK